MKPEAQLHRAVAAYLRLALRPPTIWTTIGHGGGGKVRGAQLKAMGVQPGWPDVLVIGRSMMMRDPQLVIVGFELKSPAGRQAPEQKAFEVAFKAIGGLYRIARSVEEIEQFLSMTGMELHARLP